MTTEAAAFVPDPTDVCQFGHQLARGVDEVVLKEYDGSGKKVSEQKILLRRHASMGPLGLFASDHGMGPTDTERLVPYPCAHAIPASAVPDLTKCAGGAIGQSFGRAHWLTYSNGVPPVGLIARCPVCLGEPAPDWRA